MSDRLTSEQRQELFAAFVKYRGVETPCEVCAGLGVRSYDNSSTWSHGVGCASMTTDVCDQCWGTGDAQRHGVNLRGLTAERIRELEAENARLRERMEIVLGAGPSTSIAVSVFDKAQKLTEENARLREAFEHACETAEEFYDFFENYRMLATDPEDSEICAMRRNRKELLG